MSLCYIDGGFVPVSRARIPVTDLSVQRGIGVFETIRTYRGRPMALTRHLFRLRDSAARCGISLPLDLEEIKRIIREGLSKIEGDSRARPYVTGGDEMRDGTFPNPRFFAFFEPLNPPSLELYTKGAVLFPVDMERPMSFLKSINYMQGYLPLREDPQALEILYCPDGEITESSHSNAFMVKDGRIVTAPLERVLDGTMRQMTLEIAKEAGFETEERTPRLEELQEAMEFFITGSVKEILPVVRIGKTIIGNGQPGPVAEMLRQRYLQNLERWLE
ncbi:MAG: aminotransferase class IV [Thermovirgaceae bacterium]